MADFVCDVQLGRLVPADEFGAEYLSKRHGKTVKVTVKEARSAKQLKMYWALVHLIYPHQSRYNSPQRLSSALKHAVGAFDQFECLDGTIITEVHSIAERAMPQDEFNAFIDKVLDVIVTQITPMAKGDLRRELEEITGVSKA